MEDSLSADLLAGKFQEGDAIRGVLRDGLITYERIPTSAEEAPPEQEKPE